MEESSKKICILITAKDDDIEKLKNTIENLKSYNCDNSEYVVATKKDDNEDTKKYCKDNNIESIEYSNINEVYYKIPTNLKFDYITFINSGDTYASDFKTKLLKRIENDYIPNKLYVCPIKYDTKAYVLNKSIVKNKVVDIEKKPEKKWIHLNSVFISKELLSKIKTSNKKELKYYEDVNLLIKLILLNGGYGVTKGIKLISVNKFEDSKEAKLESYDIQWYKNIFNNINDIFEFSKNNYGVNLEFAQHVCMFLLKNVINENAKDKNKHILKDKELEEFWKNVSKILQEVDDKIIMCTNGNKIVNYNLILKKYNLSCEDIEYRAFGDKIHVVNKNQYIFDASDTKIKILLMNYEEGKLVITAKFDFPFNEKKLKIYTEYAGKKIYATKNFMYSDYNLFGKSLYSDYIFDVKIPLKMKDLKEYIKFYLEMGETKVELNIKFEKPLSRLSEFKTSYWECGNYTLNYRKKHKAILVMKNSKLRHIKRELKYVWSLIKSKKKNIRSAGRLRILYDLTKPFYKKEIWLFEDKIYKGGDNGEYLYTYASKQKDGIKKYYILKKGTIDAYRFKKEKKKYVNYDTLRHKLLFLNSNIVFTTHNNTIKHHSFMEDTEKYFRDLYNSYNVCIQHGLSVQKMPNVLNRINDNLKGYFLASEVEEKNLKTKEYAYQGYEDILKITGCPRYDGLKNNDKKQILITPTWRSYLAMPVVKFGESRRRNSDFKKSNYFKIYNNLINNKKLISTAKKYGYKIVYLLHPCTSSQINDFDRNKEVELIAATEDLNYEKILTESSLMVTDYSGVQFDFAYMYKPIVYFHPDELPPSYDEGEYKYETMSLGEIVKTSDQLVDSLCEYMKNDCKVKPQYKERIDKFFKYHDYNNCKRIYEEMIKVRK